MARIAAALCLAACLVLFAQAAVVQYDAVIASVLASMNVHPVRITALVIQKHVPVMLRCGDTRFYACHIA